MLNFMCELRSVYFNDKIELKISENPEGYEGSKLVEKYRSDSVFLESINEVHVC